MTADISGYLSESVPRYTSYPTAPNFHRGIDADVYCAWLREISEKEGVSLYIHIPFCDRLCWFCACHTKMTRRYEPVAAFLEALHREITLVAALVRHVRVRAIHFGGGSPTILKPEDIRKLGAKLRHAFDLKADAEISVEIDPSDKDEGRYDAFVAIGMTRASLGVQDFAPAVQNAINREQTFEQTASVVDALRAGGLTSLNLDLLYGLPQQTEESLTNTIRQALLLAPDRIAMFGYAHVPWFKKNQRMIDEKTLPGARERFAQQQLASSIIVGAGYQTIGLDHFAKPEDSLAVACRQGHLNRNFQGYTDDCAAALIGLGLSAVSKLPQGYAQNASATGVYELTIGMGKLATARGIALTDEDRARGWVIERLMCDFGFSVEDMMKRFPAFGRNIVEQALAGVGEDETIFVRRREFVTIPENMRPFVRSAASRFDQYLRQSGARHSAAI